MERLILLIRALRYGNELKNVESWKRGGVTIAALTGLLSALSGLAVTFGYIPEAVSEEMIMQLSSAIVTIVGVILAYLQIATTKKIGVKSPNEPEPPLLEPQYVEAQRAANDAVDNTPVRVLQPTPDVSTEPELGSGYWNRKRGGLNEH
jgi:hypothetical protein